MTLNPAIVCFYSYRFTRFRRYRLFLLLSFCKVLNSRTGSLLNLITGFFIIPHMRPYFHKDISPFPTLIHFRETYPFKNEYSRGALLREGGQAGCVHYQGEALTHAGLFGASGLIIDRHPCFRKGACHVALAACLITTNLTNRFC